MSDITISDETGQAYSFTVSNKITDAILALLSALVPARATLPSKGSAFMPAPAEQTRYKL